MKSPSQTSRHTLPNARVDTIAAIVRRAANEAAEIPASEGEPNRIAAGVVTDWNNPALTLAALVCYLEHFRANKLPPKIAIILPESPTERDNIALSVLIDSVSRGGRPPATVLLTPEEAEIAEIAVVISPQNDSSDLLALAELCRAFNQFQEGQEIGDDTRPYGNA